MLKLWENGYEIVYAKRISREGETFFKLFTAKLFYKLLQSVSKINIPKDTGIFRIIDRKVVNIINDLPEHNKFLQGLFSWVGFKQIAYEYQRQSRYAGTTKYSIKKLIRIAFDAIIGFSDILLKLIGLSGILGILLAFILLVIGFYFYIYSIQVMDLKFLFILIILIISCSSNLIALWIISEYIIRIYDESRARPQYVINETINFKE